MKTNIHSTSVLVAVFAGICTPGLLSAADLGIKNGDFTSGKQFWRGDGTVITLPDGNKVIEMASNPRRQDQVSQEIEMGTLTEVEVKFRARFIGGKGQMRAKLMKKNGGSTLFAFDLPPDGVWRDISFKHQRESLKDERSIVLETLPYEGKLQIDDVWAGEPGTHTSVKPLVPTSAPPKPVPPPMPAAPVVAVVPVTPVPMPAVTSTPAPPPPATSLNYALDQILDSLPVAIRAKMTAANLPASTVDEINAHLAEVKNKPLQITLAVHTAEVVPNAPNKYRVRAADGLLSGKYPAIRQHWLWAYMPSEKATEVAQVPIGTAITLAGTVTRCDLKEVAGGLRLNMDLDNSVWVKNATTSPAPAPMPAVATTPPTTPPGEKNPDVPLTPLQQSINPDKVETEGQVGEFLEHHARIANELLKHEWRWSPTGNYSSTIGFRENGEVFDVGGPKGSEHVQGDWKVAKDGTVVYRRGGGDDRSVVWLLRVAGPGRFEGIGAVAAKGRSTVLSRLLEAGAITTKFEGTNWAWGSGGKLGLEKGGVATHSDWKSAGTWTAMDETTIFVKRPANDPPMIVEFEDSLTTGKVTSHVPSSTTVTRIKGSMPQ